MRLPRPGIRGKVLAGLLLASVATLTTAVLVTLPLLEQRLESNRLADLRGLARTARPALRSVDAERLEPGSLELAAICDRLQDRTGGRVVLYDARGRVLADTAPRRPAPVLAGVVDAELRARVGRDETTSGTAHGVAYAVTATRVAGQRLTLVIAKRLDDTRAASDVLRRALPWAALVAIVVTVALGFLLSRGLLARLTQLHADARALHEEGLTHHVAVTGDDEVADVAAALEEMRARLADEEASRKAFVSTASHELRTPLATLQATLELLREDAAAGRLDDADTTAHADLALRQTHRLTALATDLLDLSRVDGAAPLRRDPVGLLELADGVARELGARFAGRGLEVGGGEVTVAADPAATARIVRILLENARVHGSGAVRVRVQELDGDRARLTVEDDGPGVEAGEVDRLFVRFARGDAARDRPGAGLGLPIARGLAEGMGGEVAHAGGSAFVVTLPRWIPTDP
ncbi:MAG TPA: HAMP domain-containing sensor histidine kinase [Baekduia sp.]|nr:HAMP domain-containing sensor histidine kinase [Baekduia sp.]